jgi:O-antigen ligase
MGSFEFRAGWEEESSRSFGVEKDIVERHMVGIVERSTGTTIHPGLLTFNVCLVLAPIVVLMINTHPRDILRRFWWVVAIGILISALVVSYSRAGLLMLAGTFVLMLLLGVIRLGIVQLTVLTLVVILTIGLAPAKYLDRVFSSESYTTRSRSISTRLEMLEAAVGQFMDHPVLGVGYGNRYGIFRYYTTYPDKKHAITPHNAYVQMAAQVGFVGLSFLIVFLWKTHSHLRRAIRLFQYRGETDLQRLGNALYISFVVFLVEGFIADLFDKGLPQVWLLMGMIAAYIYLARESSAQVSHAMGTT